MPVTKEQFENYKNENLGFSVDSFIDKSPRTIIYGYDFNRNTHHVYIDNKVLHLYIYDANHNTIEYRNGTFDTIQDLIPIKRAYPESTDLEFLKILKQFDCNGNFTTYNEDRYERIKDKQFHGEIKQKVNSEEDIEELKQEYIGSSVNFEGNEDIEPFYATIEDFKLDTDGTIIVTIVDMEDNFFDIDWSEISDSEFDA